MWVFKSIFRCVLSVTKKICVDWKSLTTFNNEISFQCGGCFGTFLFLSSTVFVKLVFCTVQEFLGVGWICTRKVRLVGNGLVFFIDV